MAAPLMDTPIYPDVEVDLIGQDGNGFMIASRVRRALLKHLRAEINEMIDRDDAISAAQAHLAYREAEAVCATFFKEALAGSYDELLQTCMKWVTVR